MSGSKSHHVSGSKSPQVRPPTIVYHMDAEIDYPMIAKEAPHWAAAVALLFDLHGVPNGGTIDITDLGREARRLTEAWERQGKTKTGRYGKRRKPRQQARPPEVATILPIPTPAQMPARQGGVKPPQWR